MRQPTPQSPVRRIAAALLVAVLIAPAAGAAEDEAAADEESSEAEAAQPIETHWYDDALHSADVAVDLVVVRPLALVTWAAGAALFVPAVIMTAPNGTESMKEAYERFVREPGEYFYSRPLGEF